MRLRIAPFALLKRLALRLLLIAAVLWGGGIALFSVLPVPFSAVMLERQVSAWLSGDFHYLAHSDWVAMDKISPWMGLAVIAAEDQKFPEHWGFDRDPHPRRVNAVAADGEKPVFMGWPQLAA